MKAAKIAAIKRKLFIGDSEPLVLYRMTWKEWWQQHIINPAPRPSSFPWYKKLTVKYVWEEGFDTKRVLGEIAPQWLSSIGKGAKLNDGVDTKEDGKIYLSTGNFKPTKGGDDANV
jgi:hypothetical protein